MDTDRRTLTGRIDKKIYRNCLICSSSYYAKPYLIKRGYGNYCSMICYWKSKIGKPMSNKGRPLSANHRAKLSGENANNWQGGISTQNEIMRKRIEYRLWRIAVFTRDDYVCQFCNIRGGELHADHIKPFALYPELRFAIDNGRTLCVSCHKQTDTYGGRVLKYGSS